MHKCIHIITYLFPLAARMLPLLLQLRLLSELELNETVVIRTAGCAVAPAAATPTLKVEPEIRILSI